MVTIGRAATMILLLLAGCAEEGANDTSPTLNAVADIGALPERQRNAVFIRAIRDAGLDCQHVGSSAPAGSYGAMPAWTANCSNGSTWTIVVTPSGTAQILDPKQARSTG